MMKATDPVEQMDEMFNKIVNAGYEQTVALAFVADSTNSGGKTSNSTIRQEKIHRFEQ